MRSELLAADPTDEDIRSCPRVTEDVLDRLRATGEAKDLPTLEYIKDKFSKKRKSASSVSGSNISSTGSNTPGAGKSKRPRVDTNSLSHDTSTSQMKPQLSVSPEPTLSDKVTNPLLMMVGKLNKETTAILDWLTLTPSCVPSAEDRISITMGVVALQRVFRQLGRYAWVHANNPEPEELTRILGLLMEAMDPFVIGHITTSMVPDNEDKLFLLGRVGALEELLIEISTRH